MNKIFFDVGANNGSSSINAALDNDNTIVYAFEPTPTMIEDIKRKTFNLKNYNIIEKAVSNYNGTAKFKVAGQADWGCSSLLDFSENSKIDWPGRTDFKVTEEIDVDVITLEKFIEENNIEKIDYLHIDTQGSDLKVLEGLGKYISIVNEGVMEAAVKTDILYNGQNTLEQSVRFLIKHGFHVYHIQVSDHYCNEVNVFFRR